MDDDPGVLSSTQWLLESAGLAVETYSSAAKFLETYDPSRPGCLLLDIRMPGMTGVELQEKLVSRGRCPPIIFLTGHGDISTCAETMKSGAVDFIEKPANDDELLSCIHEALEKDSYLRRVEQDAPEITAHLQLLSQREREVMVLLYNGNLQKQIATKLGISVQTVSKHRIKVLEKLNVTNEAELVRLLAGYPLNQ
ncbi:MAG: response regulator transcription factor [Pirellulales bacterium]|nr:response regulator transcription factor [Pirellulales bacterium]